MNELDLEMKYELMQMTADMAASYFSNNLVDTDSIETVVFKIYESLKGIESKGLGVGPRNLKPAVPIEESVTPDYIICLEDGKKMKMIKRHIRTAYNLSPEEYRARWGLPADYPMVSPNYAARRSEFAKQIGLGNTNHAGRGRKPIQK